MSSKLYIKILMIVEGVNSGNVLDELPWEYVKMAQKNPV